ncbi:CshA/CshB family fibrillar adhesin-related protein [Nocardioides caeni]|uniref:CshA/CshB family fibrillar adhesin-related protein n=1 Tax=Nocardioides caeni TaxID=574700 RepID=UPI0031E93289
MRKIPRRLAASALATACLGALLVGGHPPASAQYATEGSGAYVGSVDWFEWGVAGQVLTAGSPFTVTNTTSVGGHTLATTCTVSNLDRNVRVYNPTSWGRSGINALYRGTGLVNGLSVSGATASFDLSCSATFDGEPYALPGLVMADAEQSASNEWVQITAQSPATVQVIDRTRAAGCTGDINADATTVQYDESTTGTQVRFSNTSLCASGPTAVSYVSADHARVAMKGGGTSALAVGVMLPQEYSDGPTSYGDAGYLVRPTITGGVIPAPAAVGDPAVRTPLFAGFTPATFTSGLATLGAGQTFEGTARSNATATGDNDDAFSTPPAISGVVAGQTYSLAVPITRHGNAVLQLRGFIDWNGNGQFEADEASNPTSQFLAATGNRTLTWTVPGDVRSSPEGGSLLRLRLAQASLQPLATGASVASPVGLWAQPVTTTGQLTNYAGEVEDYLIPINVPINAMDDDFTASAISTAGGTTPSVLINDTVGAEPATTENVTFTLTDEGGLAGAILNPDGTVTVPPGTEAAVYELTYEICQTADSTSCSTAMVRISIFDQPTAEPDTASTVAGVPLTIDPVTNDQPSTGSTFDPTTLLLIDPASNEPVTSVTTTAGVYEVVDGQITFTPAEGYTGTDEPIGYQITDTSGQVVPSTLTVTVGPMAEWPILDPLVGSSLAALALLVGGVLIVRRRRQVEPA